MRLLQVTHRGAAGAAVLAFTGETARLLGGSVYDLGGEQAGAAEWRRTLSETQPEVVFVQHLGTTSPAMLLDLSERGIPYAVFLHDYSPLCPTQRLWHRHQERCSGPARLGWKCAWCISGSSRRAAELPLRMSLYRHRPEEWRTALIRAEALVATSRFARDFWVEQGAPPERVAVVAPVAEAPVASDLPPAAGPRRLLWAGGRDTAAGEELLTGALSFVHQPLRLVTMEPPFAQGDIVVAPARWEATSARAALEAQLAGIPVVATAVGAFAESIIHGINGFLATPDDVHSLAEALKEALAVTGPAWDGDRVMINARAKVSRTRRCLQRLLELLVAGAMDPALLLEHEGWLTEVASTRGVSVAEASQQLIAALRQPDGSDPSEPLEHLMAIRADSGSRRRQLDLNHAIAFLRAWGCRRIAHLPETAPPAVDAVAAFQLWNLETVAPDELPDGLYIHTEDNSGIMTEKLSRRYPQARALVAVSPRGVETRALPRGEKD